MSGTVLEFGPILRAMKRNRSRIGLIVLEIALTLAIVTNCVGLILDARQQMRKPSGFDDANLLSVRTSPFDRAFSEDGYLDNSRRQDLDALKALPGVRAVSNTRFLPWQGGGSSTELRPANTKGEMLRTQIYNADEGTFEALGMNVVAGRSFSREETDADTLRIRALLARPRARNSEGTPVEKTNQDVLITQAFAKHAFGEQGSYLGQMLEDSDGDTYRVVGVVDPFYNPYGWPIHEYAVFFMGYSRSFQGGASFLVRTEPGQAAAVARAIEQKLVEVNAGRTVTVKTIDEIKAQFFGGQQAVATLMTVVVFLLVFVTSLGIVGLTSFSVTERTRHIGTRRALGARRRDIVGHFLLENWLVTSMGLVLGVVAA